jgi:Rrf2 family protein
MLERAAAGGLVKGEQVATAQGIPQKFLETILAELRNAELVASRRGVEGGYALARPAEAISLADVIRAVEGPIATVRGVRPDEVAYEGAASALGPVWSELRAAMLGVLEETTLADVVARSGVA